MAGAQSVYLGFRLLGPIIILGITNLLLSAQGEEVPASSDELTAEDLHSKHDHLEESLKALQLALIEERAKVLEKMREEVRTKVEEWERDPEFLDGKGLQLALQQAEIVGAGYGFQVEKLRDRHLALKKIILNLEMVGKCGAGNPQLEDSGDVFGSLADIGKGVMDVFGLVASEEARLACVQEEKLKLYKEVNRAYIYALTAADALESADGFRRYGDQIAAISNADAAVLAKEAENLAKAQDEVLFVFELTPLVGELIDLYKLGLGTDLMGQNVSGLDRAVTAVLMLTPGIIEQLLKRYPEVFYTYKSFLAELAYPGKGFFDTLIVDTGKKLSLVKDRASVALERFVGLEKQLAEKVGGSVRSVAGENISAIWNRLESMPGFRMSQAMAVDASNIIDQHVNAIREVATKGPGRVIMFRPFNPLGQQAIADAIKLAKKDGTRLATKWMDVKPKSASNPILGAAIPVNPALSKLDDGLRRARASGSPAAIAKAEAEIESMRGKVQDLLFQTDSKGNKIVEQIPATYGTKVEGELVEKPVYWSRDISGELVMGVLDQNGKLFDPISMRSLDVDPMELDRVMVIASPEGNKVLPDYDMFAVGSKSRPNDKVIGPKGEIVDEQAPFVAGLGIISRDNLDTMTDINEAVARRTGVKGDVVHHGAANFWQDLPDYPITVFMPNGDVKSIVRGPSEDPDKWTKEFFHALKQEGYSGFDPHPSWGWPPYSPRIGYRGEN